MLLFKVGNCIVLCTITAIDYEYGWFYLACKECNKELSSVRPKNYTAACLVKDQLTPSYYCGHCKTYSPQAVRRYFLLFTSSTSLTNIFIIYCMTSFFQYEGTS